MFLRRRVHQGEDGVDTGARPARWDGPRCPRDGKGTRGEDGADTRGEDGRVRAVRGAVEALIGSARSDLGSIFFSWMDVSARGIVSLSGRLDGLPAEHLIGTVH